MNTTRASTRRAPALALRLLALAGVIAVPAACESPIKPRTEHELRRAALASVRSQIRDAEQHAELRRLETTDQVGRLELGEDELEQIRRDYSVPGYLERLRAEAGEGVDPVQTLLGENLYGQPHAVVPLALVRAVGAAVEHNLEVESARFGPAIAEADVVAARAAFDWTFSSSFAWQDTDQPQPGPGFLMIGQTTQAEQSVSASAGLNRRLTTGGTVGVSQNLVYTDTRASAFGAVGDPNPATTVQYDLEFNQPLLEGFGSEVNLAEVRVAQNAERSSISRLRGQLITTVTSVEDAYWDLVLRYNELVIRSRVLERGEAVRDEIRARRGLDARQAELADAVATVERRRGDVLRAQTALRRASDRLKALINDPALPVGGEALLIPADAPPDAPFEFSLLDSITEAVRARPEVEQAILGIDDASIRQVVARNAALPRVDLQARLTLIGLDDDAAGAYDRTFESEFIDSFLLGVSLEQPIGNREGEALRRQARLARMRSVVDFRRTVQQVVLEVKNALDQVALNQQLISQARLSRIAQGEALRTLLVEKEFGDEGYSITRLNLELNQQDALANAELSETAAIIDYNRAVADLHAATGTSLRRNRIDFVVPDVNQVEPGHRGIDYRLPDEHDASGPAPTVSVSPAR